MSTISGPKLQAAVTAFTGATLSLRSIQRAKKKLVDTSDVQQASPMSKLRPYLRELEKHSPGTVTDVEVRVFYQCVCVRQINRKPYKNAVADPVGIVYVLQPHVSNCHIMDVVHASYNTSGSG